MLANMIADTAKTQKNALLKPVRNGGFWLKSGAVITALLAVLPIVCLVFIALSGTTESLSHITSTVLPSSGLTTVLLLIGVGLITGLIGVFGAWAITFFDFPGRKTLAWALMLPLAVPTYISAYAFVEFMSFTGPLQALLRAVTGFQSARDYWFPDIRSVAGAAFVLGIVLYPYVYMAVRALFYFQSARIVETARTLGSGHFSVFTSVLVPMARPAIALGMVLAMMETINDIGAMEHLGVETLTFSVFSVWLNQGDMSGAAQIALLLLAIVILLIFVERKARAGQQYFEVNSRSLKTQYVPVRLDNYRGWAVTAVCALPILLGFGIPFFVLGNYALRYIGDGISDALWSALVSGIGLALLASLLTVAAGLLLAYALRTRATLFGNPAFMAGLVRLASVGYAIPGTIIALGIFLPLASFDNFVDGMARSWFGISTGLLITGSGATLVFAYVVRFMAIAEGTLDGGFKKLSPSLDRAARSLGKTENGTLKRILLPLMQPAILTAGALVFVDSLKELSATIMLKPFGVETLATHIYDLASRGRIEEAGIACMIIIMVGILPVAILSNSMLRGK